VAAGTPEVVATPGVGVEAAGQEVEVEVAGREAGWDVEEAWAGGKGEDKAIGPQVA
jgi:hypothetical protein